jgi:hypothetical protein
LAEGVPAPLLLLGPFMAAAAAACCRWWWGSKEPLATGPTALPLSMLQVSLVSASPLLSGMDRGAAGSWLSAKECVAGLLLPEARPLWSSHWLP